MDFCQPGRISRKEDLSLRNPGRWALDHHQYLDPLLGCSGEWVSKPIKGGYGAQYTSQMGILGDTPSQLSIQVETLYNPSRARDYRRLNHDPCNFEYVLKLMIL